MDLKRREFITLLGGAAATWPLAAGAQPGERVRRVGVLMSMAAEGQPRITALAQGMRELGWAVGRNLQIDYRWAAGDPDRIRKYAAELVALAPDVILANSTPLVAALQQATPPFQSCLWGSPTLSVQAWSRVWRGRATIPPALLYSNTGLAGNG
jgi:putative tryptophan/tyrosine transport system substrate-binding protein